jgi:tetratricopeptide (TPR) repeat protein
LARAYVSVERRDDALQVLARLFGAHPSDSDAHLLAGRIHLSRERYPEARRHFEAVRMRNPFNPEIHMALAQLYDAEGKKGEAEQERHFLRLSSKPRPTRDYELPPPRTGDARISIVAPGWTPVRIDGELPEATPAWRRQIAAGPHSVEFVDAAGKVRVRSFTIEAGGHEVLVLE